MSRLAGPLSALSRWSRGKAGAGGAVVLSYHDVVTGPEVDLDLNVTAAQLRHHLTLVRRLGFRFLPLTELSERAVRGDALDGLAAVTFDDALAGVARHGVPVLQELGVPATLFTVSTMWGSPPRWWAGSGPTMTRSELLASRELGLGIAAHTRTHASLPALGDRQGAAAVQREVAGSRAELEDLVQAPVDIFAYPFGHHDATARQVVAEAGYVAAYTFLNGRLSGTEDPLRLPRFTMGQHHSRARLSYHLSRAPGSWPDHQGDRVTG